MKRLQQVLLNLVLLIVITYLVPQAVLAQSESPSEIIPWYQVAAGILAIPTTIIGIAYSWVLIRKSNLEARKIALEIQEKERQLQNTSSSPEFEAVKEIAQPFFFNQRILLILLRYILLELTLRFWSFVPAIFSEVGRLVGQSVAALILVLGEGQFPTSDYPILFAGLITVGASFVDVLFGIVRWFIIFGLGWPLLQDTAELLGFSISNLLDLPKLLRQRHTTQTQNNDSE